MLETLGYIGQKLNDEKVNWGLGGSLLMKLYQLVDYANDIDLIVDINDVVKVDDILGSIGKKKKSKRKSIFSSEWFESYIVNGIDIDVIAGFKINHREGTYNYNFDKHSLSKIYMLNCVTIPLTSLEDWYVIYQILPNKENKLNKLVNHLRVNQINEFLLKRALKGNLPEEVKNKINSLIT
ncbi:hypothetical protein KHQ82_10475 [Mycoplasmatota bacterium]|nr:hypothetical protein KHQ82_10475 [Mycoplasmatota bacterium]